MFLRSLTVRGFKSFADKTTLEFTPGVSVIVGPNGSGKSNIADAIAWVLGEQGPRALRGAQMADVVFAGSPKRPALGMSEVSMVIDNAAGLIPVPASEIEISRAIYRSGESEYRLGGRPCRLMDIQELLSDTGVGRTLHTIIGQGHLDDVLTARPEDRRLYIEEAAGISKHRRRRERARARLSGLEGDLLRLQDLTAELRRQLKPLRQQADLAERHQKLTADADHLARKLGAARLRDLLAERDRRRPEWERAEAQQAEARARLAALDREIARLDRARLDSERASREAEAAQQWAAEARAEAESRVRRALREEGAARARMAGATNRSARLFSLEEESNQIESRLQEVRAALAERESELDTAEREFRAAEDARRRADERHRRSMEEAAARRAEAHALNQSLASHRAELERIDLRTKEIDGTLAETTARSEALEAEVERLDGLEAPLIAEQAALDEERSALAQRVASLEADELGFLARQEVVRTRRQELSESPGAGFLRRRGGRAIGLLRELIEAPADLRPALKGALGSFGDAVVYANADDAIESAGHAGGDGVLLGVAGLVTIAALPPAEGGTRRLLDHVRVDGRVSGLAAALLGNVFVVSNLAEAAARHRVRPGAQFVTPDGTVVGSGFVRTPAQHDVRLEAIRREEAGIERDLALVRRDLREARIGMGALADRAAAGRRDVERIDGLITAAADEMAQVQKEVASLERERQVLSERGALVDAALEAITARLGELPPGPTDAEPAPVSAEAPHDLRVEVESLRRERSRLEAEAGRIQAEIEAAEGEDPGALSTVLGQAERERAAAEEVLRAGEDGYARTSAAFRAAAEGARSAAAALGEANRSWRAASSELDRVRDEHEQEDMARADLDRRIEDAERTLVEGHGVHPGVALGTVDPADTVEDLRRQSELVARKLGLLGRVNLLATGELESLKERHDFLSRELEDVRSAWRDLERVIEDVDRQMADLFEMAFRDVAREFSSLFAHLFPGGEGRLTLIDPADPLASGIEVEARPGRKKVRRLSLLSGGERSLAALAFLFAIFRARPSPFYLMDEVEAALDDVNLHRFLEIVKEFAKESQIIVVTHQKRTMEMADVLYGVSMGQDGASAVISQRLAEVETVDAGS